MRAAVISFALLSICGIEESTCGMQGLLWIMFRETRGDRRIESNGPHLPVRRRIVFVEPYCCSLILPGATLSRLAVSLAAFGEAHRSGCLTLV
jgi:hypothetical protein